MVYVNRPDSAFRPSGDRGNNGVWFLPPEGKPRLENGLYFRDRQFPELTSEIEHCKAGDMAWSDLTIDAYQSWNETGWKAQHSTIAAVQRFIQKQREERQEVDDALEEYFDTQDPAHLIEELGDYGYVTTALANLAGAAVSDGLATQLFKYGKGTRQYDGDNAEYPVWYDDAMHVAVQREPITIGSLDGLMEAGFSPAFSTAMNRYDDETDGAIGYVFDFYPYGAILGNLVESQFERQPYDAETRSGRPVYWSQELSESVGQVSAEVYLRLAWIAKSVGSTLSSVIETNVTKISQRIETRTVDRTDGSRAVQ